MYQTQFHVQLNEAHLVTIALKMAKLLTVFH